MTATSRRRELGQLVRRARGGITAREAAKKANVSPVTWGKVERGEDVKPFSLAAIERSLGWPPGASEDFLTGGPAPSGPAQTSSDVVGIDRVLALDRPDVTKVALIKVLHTSTADPVDAILALDITDREKVELIKAYREALSVTISSDHRTA